jgi:hypothetical protein
MSFPTIINIIIFYIKHLNRQTGVIITLQDKKSRYSFVIFKASYIAKENMKTIPRKIRAINIECQN